jgi:hypothetical protein
VTLPVIQSIVSDKWLSSNDLKSSVEKLGLNLGMSEQHGPKKTGIPKHEVSNEEVDKAQRPSSPPSGKEDIKEVTPYSSLPDVVQRTDMSVEDNVKQIYFHFPYTMK